MSLDRLKVRREKRIAILAMVQCHRAACRKKGSVGHAQEAEQRPQIRLDKIERCHLRLGVVDTTGGNDECRFLADEQTLRYSVAIREGFPDAGDLVDP